MPITRRYARIVPLQAGKLTLTRLILGKISEAGEVLLDGFFPAKYPEARLWRGLLGLDRSYEFKRATFASLLSQLRAEGLIEKVTRQRRARWRLTSEGRSAIQREAARLPPRSDGRKRLVCFDVPERERAKRKWLRGELIACGYQPLQKSVWVGTAPLPHDFVAALDALGLRGCVHLLRVESEGTLRRGRGDEN